MNNLMTQNDNTTIITEYKFTPKEPKAYQSEEDLEKFLIKELTLQGYERLNLSDINDLESNLNYNFKGLIISLFHRQNGKVFIGKISLILS